MALTDREKYIKRIAENKQYRAYIPNFMAEPFDKKLKEKNLTFTNFLKDSIEKFLKRS